MSNTNPTREELFARTDDSHRIGIDACGLAHYYDCVAGVIWTTTALGDIAHVVDVDSLDAWDAFVAGDRGWLVNNISQDDLGDALARCA